MLANSREELVEVFDALDAELDRLDEVSFEVLTTPERLAMLERLERLARRLPAVGHALINQLDAQAGEEELGATLCCALANRLRITKPDAARRIADAADLGPRRALTGEPLAPQLTATATAQRQGRNHDGLLAGLRALIASGKLGQHNGLPVSIVVTTTLTDLQNAAGKGFTGGGSLLPMADVIRMASHAHHYLAIFDHGTPLALYHTKRLASPAQRIMLFARDRGCTKPGCDAPAYHSQAHHVQGWASTRRTDITDLTLACGPDNRLAEKGWITRKNTKGDTEWLPPAHLDHGQPRTNTFHHPEKLLRDDDDKPD
ncbi:HNH endonuclease signature motif containing protein [Mycobacterium canetti]|uniref:HNH endonuclease signature motif containing protein n=1 Tax=Mycobacterium canetti TaxID=78331 RepID=UPI001E3988AE|nr:HNH endonuclease signature motif containing protein [Mycobacterium canetti]